MTNLRSETRKLAIAFIATGTLTMALAVLALALPEQTLIAAMLTVGLIAVLSGLNQILSAVSIRARAKSWRLLLTHGILAFGFGLLTVGATALPLSIAAVAIALWLAAHAILAARITADVRTRWLRRMLVASAVVDFGLAVVLIVLPAVSIFQFLFVGAIYAVLFGISQLGAGISLRSARLDHPQVPTADVLDAHHIQTPSRLGT